MMLVYQVQYMCLLVSLTWLIMNMVLFSKSYDLDVKEQIFSFFSDQVKWETVFCFFIYFYFIYLFI